MKFKDLQQKSKEELEKLLAESKLELMKERAQAAIGTQMKSPGRISALKQTIARIKFIQKKHG